MDEASDRTAAPLRLTQRVACAGCAAKLGPAELAQVLGVLVPNDDPRVLVDHRTGDDAGVFRLDEKTALVQTVDFFTPVVDDPEAFGAIAAANAVSDVYAMGGRPLTALSIAAFPDQDFPMEWAAAIVRGGQAALRKAGCVLLGGHSIRDPEIKFGYAITGLVDPERMITNAGGRPGDVLVLTKPLGTGIVATALKAGRAPEAAAAAAMQSMAQLNRIPSVIAVRNGVRAATDITGFGLVGHALGIARQSGLTLEIRAAALPLLPSALALAPSFQPSGLKANRRQFGPFVRFAAPEPEPSLQALLFDPQTSGGLLLLVPETKLAAVLAELPNAREIGVARDAGDHPIVVL
jgi:selenide,water dikinase